MLNLPLAAPFLLKRVIETPGKEPVLELTAVANECAQTFIMSKLYPSFLKDRVILWCLNTDQEAEKISSLLKFWLGLSKINLPVYQGFNQTEPLSALLNHRPSIIVFNFDQINKPLPSPEEFKKAIIHLSVDQKIAPAEMAQLLIGLGYEWDMSAVSSGTFARRGGIIDVFPLTSKLPIKVEFEANQIKTIQDFDPLTKKMQNSLTAVDIIPIRLPDADQAHILDYLKNAKPIIIFSDPELMTTEHQDWESFVEKIKPWQKIIWQTFAKNQSMALDFQTAPYWHGNLRQAAENLKAYQQNNWQILVASNRVKELQQLFKEFGVQSIPIVQPQAVLSGFKNKVDQILFLTDLEIFGPEKTPASTIKSRIDLAFIQDLKPGDYAVHLDHGIGRFLGTQIQKIDGLEKEYLVLEYAETDKLYVPVETAHKIEKYLGQASPKLGRLSGSSWIQLTARIKKETEKIAHDLLNLYARREITQATAMEDYPEEIKLAASFPYQETPDQQKAIQAVNQDLKKEKPMDRLICGDVGFGKTEIAIRSAFKALLNGKQVALLAPTTILTQQHFDTFSQRLGGFPVVIEHLSRFKNEKQQKATLEKLKNGQIDIIIGTHRLLSEDVHYKDLGLIIIDEEQRFGVKHKEKLKELRAQAHVLTLSATPIPRTLNLALSGLRDISVIATPPEGRLPIATLIEPFSEAKIKAAINAELERNGQIYYLYNQVETINLKANHLKQLLPQAKIGVAHGQLDEQNLMQVMDDFDHQRINLLVCSTIIQNGLDLPNVNTLIVENAPKFGLAQLYQIRGRIGRSSRQAYAYFFYQSEKLSEAAKKRLQALLEAKELGSGFQIAMRDLELRGAGHILGRAQHGHLQAIGLNLYLRLLNQAVLAAQTGAPLKPEREILFDLPLALGIPKKLVPNEAKRLKIYQQLANINDLRELEIFKNKNFEAQGMPEPLANLFKLMRLKIMAGQTEIMSIETTRSFSSELAGKKLSVNFAASITPQQIETLLKMNPGWHFSQNQIKIEMIELGNNWLNALEKVISIFILPTDSHN